MTEVRQLAKLLRSFDLSRLEYEKDGTRIMLEREVPAAPAAAPQTAASAAAPAQTDAKQSAGTPVTSPLVGVAYRAREPGAPPLVEVGQRVKKGDPVAIIEAMKMFSDIPSPCDGTVLELLFEDGSLVEYGTPLLMIGCVC